MNDIKPAEWISVTEITEPKRADVFISIPKRVVRLSTARNRIRRLIRESLRLSGHGPDQKTCWRISVRKPFPPKTKLKDVDGWLDEAIQNRKIIS